MTETYTPKVGAVYDPAMFENWTPEQILHRDLKDPAFSDKGVGSTHYDWRPDFILKIDNPKMFRQVEKFLDNVASTPEGRWHLRQAAAMQRVRQAHGNTFKGSDSQGRIFIESIKIHQPQSPGRFSEQYGTISLTDPFLPVIYRGIDGKNHISSFENTIYHELGHAKDPMVYSPNYAAEQTLESIPFPAKSPRDFVENTKEHRKIMGNCVGESPVIHDLNQAPRTLHLGAPRSLDHEAGTLKIPKWLILEGQRIQAAYAREDAAYNALPPQNLTVLPPHPNAPKASEPKSRFN